MKLLTVCVGTPRLVRSAHEDFVSTAIFKEPVQTRVRVNQLNLEGDQQADLRVHGGPSKSVYVYPGEHYKFWRAELPEMTLVHGQFGENLTTEGLLETDTCIGDKISIGTAEFAVTEPRMPCFKLGIRFGRKDIIRRFLKSGRSGFYLMVLKTGDLGAGDDLRILERDKNRVSVRDIVRLYVEDKRDFETMKRAISVDVLPEGWKKTFKEMLQKA